MPTRAHHPLLTRVGTRIRKIRTERGLSQEAVAHAADMDRSYLSGLERGEFNVSLLALAKIARALKVPPASLLEAD